MNKSRPIKQPPQQSQHENESGSTEALINEHNRNLESFVLTRDQALKVLQSSTTDTFAARDAERQLQFANSRIQAIVVELENLTRDDDAVNALPIRGEASLLRNPLASPNTSKPLSLQRSKGSVSRIINQFNSPPTAAAPSLPQRLPTRKGSAPLVNASDIKSPQMHALAVKVVELEKKNMVLDTQLLLLQSQQPNTQLGRSMSNASTPPQVNSDHPFESPFQSYLSYFSDYSFRNVVHDSTNMIQSNFDLSTHDRDLKSAITDHVRKLESKFGELEHVMSECFATAVDLKTMHQSQTSIHRTQDIIQNYEKISELFIAFLMIISAEKAKLRIPFTPTRRPSNGEIMETIRINKSSDKTSGRRPGGVAPQPVAEENDMNNARFFELSRQLVLVKQDKKLLEQKVTELQKTAEESNSRSHDLGAEVYRLKALLMNHESQSTNPADHSQNHPSAEDQTQELARTRTQLKEYKTLIGQAAQAVQKQDTQHKDIVAQLNEEIKTLREQNQGSAGQPDGDRIKNLEEELAECKLSVKKKHLLINKLKDELNRVSTVSESTTTNVRQSMLSNRKSTYLASRESKLINSPPLSVVTSLPSPGSRTSVAKGPRASIANGPRASVANPENSSNLILNVTEALQRKTQMVTQLQTELRDLQTKLDQTIPGSPAPRELAAILASTRGELDHANKEIKALNERISQDVEKLKTLETENENLKIQHKDDHSKIQRLAKMVREYKTQSTSRMSEVEKLNHLLNDKSPTTTAPSSSQQEDVQQISTQLKNANRVIEDYETEIAKLTMKLQRSVSEIATLKKQNEKSKLTSVAEPPMLKSRQFNAPAETAEVQFNGVTLGSRIRQSDTNANNTSSSSVLSGLGSGMDKFDRSRDLIGSSVKEIKNRLHSVERVAMDNSSKALGDEGINDDPDVTKLISENNELRHKLDDLLNQLAATSDIDYLRSQLAKLPTFDEVEHMKNVIASMSDYDYIRAKLADLPSKDEVEAYRNEIASMSDYSYIRAQLADLPSKNEIETYRNDLASMSDYSYLRAQLANLPSLNEIEVYRNEIASMSDYSYIRAQLTDLPSKDEIEYYRSEISSKCDYDYLRKTISSMPTAEQFDQALIRISETSDYEFKHARLMLLESQSNMDSLSLANIHTENLGNEQPSSETFKNDLERVQKLDHVSHSQSNAAETPSITFRNRSVPSPAPTVVNNVTREPSTRSMKTSSVISIPAMDKIVEEPTVVTKANFSASHDSLKPNDPPRMPHVYSADAEATINSLLNTLASYSDYEYLREQLSKLPSLDEVEKMRNELASMSDYHYIRAQLAELPSKAEIEAYRNEIASMCDYSFIRAQLAEMPSKNEIERYRNTLASMSDYDYIRSQLSGLPSINEIQVYRNEIASMADYSYVRAQLADLPSKDEIDSYRNEIASKCDYDYLRNRITSLPTLEQFDQALTRISETSDYEYKHARLLHLESLEGEVGKSSTCDYEHKHALFLQVSASSKMDQVEAPRSNAAAPHPSQESALVKRELEKSMRDLENMKRDLHNAVNEVDATKQQLMTVSNENGRLRIDIKDLDSRLKSAEAASSAIQRSVNVDEQVTLRSPDTVSDSARFKHGANIDPSVITSLQNTAASQVDYEYLRDQLSKLPSLDEVEKMKNELASMADYHYIRAQLADLPSKNEIEAYRNEIASMSDYTYIRAQLTGLPSKNEVEVYRNNLAAMSDYDYIRSQLSNLPSQNEIEVYRNELASMSDYSYIRSQLAAVPSKDEIEAYRNEIASKCDYDYLRNAISSLPTAEQFDQALTRISETSDYEYKHARLMQLESLEGEVEKLRYICASTCDYEHKHAQFLHVSMSPKMEELTVPRSIPTPSDRASDPEESYLIKRERDDAVNELIITKQKLMQVSDENGRLIKEIKDIYGKLKLAQSVPPPSDQLPSRSLPDIPPASSQGKSNLSRSHVEPIHQEKDGHSEDVIANLESTVNSLRNTLASFGDYEYLREQLSKLPTIDEVENMRNELASMSDYHYIRAQLSELPSKAEIESYRNEIASMSDYSYIRAQLVALPSKDEIEAIRNDLASMCDYSYIRTLLADLPSNGEIESYRNEIAIKCDYDYLRKTIASMPTEEQFEQALTRISETSDYEYKHARLILLESLQGEVEKLRYICASTCDYEHKHAQFLQVSIIPKIEEVEAPRSFPAPTPGQNEELALIKCQLDDAVNELLVTKQKLTNVADENGRLLKEIRVIDGKLKSAQALPPPPAPRSAPEVQQPSSVAHVDTTIQAIDAPSQDVIVQFQTTINSLLNTVASYGDYEYLREQLSLLPTLGEVEQMRNELASMSDYHYIRARLAELPSLTEIEVYRNEIASMSDYSYIRSQLAGLPSKEEIELYRNEIASMCDYNYIRARLSELPSMEEIELYRNEIASKCDYEYLRNAVASMPTSEQFDQVLSRISETSDYEYKHARLMLLEPLEAEVNILRYVCASTCDYEHKHSQFLQISANSDTPVPQVSRSLFVSDKPESPIEQELDEAIKQLLLTKQQLMEVSDENGRLHKLVQDINSMNSSPSTTTERRPKDVEELNTQILQQEIQEKVETIGMLENKLAAMGQANHFTETLRRQVLDQSAVIDQLNADLQLARDSADSGGDSGEIIKSLNQEIDDQIKSVLDLKIKLSAAQEELDDLKHENFGLRKQIEETMKSKNSELEAVQSRYMEAEKENENLSNQINQMMEEFKLQFSGSSASADEANDHIDALKEINAALEERLSDLQDELDGVLEKNMELVLQIAQ